MISWTRAVLGQSQVIVQAPASVEEAIDSLTRDRERLRAAPPVSRLPGRLQRWIVPACGLLAAASIGFLIRERRAVHRLEEQVRASTEHVGQLGKRNDELAQRVSNLQAERDALDERVFSAGVQLSALTSELERAHTQLAESQRLASQVEPLQTQLEAQAISQRLEREAARSETDRLKREKTDLSRSVLRLRQQLTLIDRDYRKLQSQLTASVVTPNPEVNLITQAVVLPPVSPSAKILTVPPRDLQPLAVPREEAVQLEPVTVRGHQANALAPVRGHLVDVNTAHRFVVIDKGSMDGVREGMEFDVRRGNALVGRTKAIRVRPQLAACHIVGEAAQGAPRVGDQVTQRVP